VTGYDAVVFSDIIHTIYSDLSVPGTWEEIVRLISKVIPVDGAMVRRFDSKTGDVQEFISIGIDSDGKQEYKDYYHSVDPVTPKVLGGSIKVCRPEDVVPELASSEYFTDYVLRYHRFPRVLISTLASENDWYGHFCLGRMKGRENFTLEDLDYLNLLTPHLSRALAEANRKRDLERVRDMLVLGLEEIPSAIFLFDANGKLVQANKPARDMKDDTANHPANLFESMRASANQLISDPSAQGEFSCSRKLELVLQTRTYQLERFITRNIGSGTYCCVKVVDRWYQIRSLVERLCSRRNLTQRETEICLLLVKGLSSRDIADSAAISEFTVKDHIKHIFRKLDISSKNEILPRSLGIAADN